MNAPQKDAARPLHAVGQARPLPARHAGARCRALARRLSRLASAAAAAFAGAARSRSPKATSPSTASRRAAGASVAFLRDEERYVPSAASSERPPARLPGDHPGRPRRRRAAGRARSTARSSGSAPRRGSSSAIRPPSSAMSRSTSPTWTSRSATSTGCCGRWRENGGSTAPRIDVDLLAAGAESPARRRMEGDGRRPPRPRRAGRHRALARPAQFRLRHRRRHRLDDHRLPSLRAALRRTLASAGTAQPADPLRRGSDEPRLLCDDESGRPRSDDAGGARRRRRADRQGLRGGRHLLATRSSNACSSAIRSCITSSSASTRPSSAARRSRSPSPTR